MCPEDSNRNRVCCEGELETVKSLLYLYHYSRNDIFVRKMA